MTNFRYSLFNVLFSLKNTDAVHLALKLNHSELKGRKLRVQRCVEQEKAQQKSLEKNVKTSFPKNIKTCNSNAFSGEKATPVKSKKARSKSMKRNKRN